MKKPRNKEQIEENKIAVRAEIMENKKKDLSDKEAASLEKDMKDGLSNICFHCRKEKLELRKVTNFGYKGSYMYICENTKCSYFINKDNLKNWTNA